MDPSSFVTVIVVNWNGREFLRDCLKSLLAQTYSPREILVIDNGSTDDSLSILESEFRDKVRLIQNKTNLGFPAAVNLGTSQARGEYIALLNNDAVAEPGWLSEMVQAIQADPQTGMCACKVYLTGQEKVFDNVGSLISYEGLGVARGRMESDQGQYDHLREALTPVGCAGLYRKSMLEAIRGFDARFFLYEEDVDAGLRARMLGYRCAFAPRAVVRHRLSASTSRISHLKVYYVERNRTWLLLKCFPLPDVLLSAGYSLQRYLFHFYSLFLKRGTAFKFVTKSSVMKLLWILVRIQLSTLTALPHLLRERSRIQRTSVLSRREFLELLRAFQADTKHIALTYSV